MMTGKNLLGITCRAALVLVVAVMFAAPAQALITVDPWVEIFSGIDHARGYADGTGGNPLQKVNCLQIDLTNPKIEFYATPHSGSLETRTQKTGDFLTEHNLQVATNAHFWYPWEWWRWDEVYDTSLRGAAVSQGNVVSSSQSGYEELLISQDNDAWFDTSPSNSFTGVYTAVAGNVMVVVDGVVYNGTNTDVHPRTAVGISQDDRYLYMMTIDGRQSGVSEGADYKDTGDWLVRFGAHDGLNIDGGGSTTMVMDDGLGGYDLLNVPVGNPLGGPGVERCTGSNIGIRIIPEPSTIALLLIGIVCLAALAVRRKLKCWA